MNLAELLLGLSGLPKALVVGLHHLIQCYIGLHQLLYLVLQGGLGPFLVLGLAFLLLGSLGLGADFSLCLLPCLMCLLGNTSTRCWAFAMSKSFSAWTIWIDSSLFSVILVVF